MNRKILFLLIILVILTIFTYKIIFKKSINNIENMNQVVLRNIYISRCDSYKNKNIYKNKHNIICSFTTTPMRINKIQDTIYTLENQTMLPKLILLNIPEYFSRTNENYIIPNFIKENSLIKINNLLKDYGPITKLVGSLLYYKEDEDQWIIIHDDDQLYLQNTIKVYSDYIEKYDKKGVYSVSGFNLVNDNVIYYKEDMKELEFLEGYCTFCFHRSYFKKDFFNYLDFVLTNKDCKFSDDLIISNYFAKHNIKIYQIYDSIINRDKWWSKGCNLELGEQQDALKNLFKEYDDSLGGHLSKYLRAIEFLKQNNMYYIK